MNTDFSRDLQGWNVKGDGISINCQGDGLCIQHDVSNKYSELAQCFKTQELPSRVILQSLVRSEQVIPGPKVWHLAKVGFVGYDDQGKGLYQHSTRLIGLAGSWDWQQSSKDYLIRPEASRYCVEIALYASPGSFFVRNISLHDAEAQPIVEHGRLILLFAWLSLSIWILFPIVKKLALTSRGRLILLLVFFIITGTLLPRDIKQLLELEIQKFFASIGLYLQIDSEEIRSRLINLWPRQMSISKLGHLLGFGLLSALYFWDSKNRLKDILPSLLLLAVCTETLQVFVMGRTPQLSDFNVDLVGIMIGWIIGRSVDHQRSN